MEKSFGHVISIIFGMLIIYGIPLLFKSYKKKEYEYPEIPPRVPEPPNAQIRSPKEAVLPIDLSEPDYASVADRAAAAVGGADNKVQEDFVIRGSRQFTHSDVVNGIIFSEIIGPPKARRPRHR
ncbi:MAG: hypothetical protein H6Q75_805 [Firmicutes bacterium]|nr:hypothetical protein [Bacillota bacterium]